MTNVKTELKDYLERLGLTVEEIGRDGLVASRRTILADEETSFRVVETVPRRTPKSTKFILSSRSALSEDIPNAYHFDEFLDSTIQSDRLANAVMDDATIREDLEAFIPQHIAEQGNPQALDAVKYFFQNWLSDDNARLLVVLGPAGYGKTVLTRFLASRLATQHLDPTISPRPPFPFLIPFGQFRRVADFQSMILSAIHQKGITDFTAGAFAYLVQRQRCILLLDGFDELLEERPDEARKNLRELIETLRGQGRVVVTARSTFFRTSTDVADFLENYLSAEDVRVLDLLPFDSTQRRELVQRVAPDQRTIATINKLLELEGLTEAMGSPLLLHETIGALARPEVRKQLERKSARRKDIFGILESSVYARERERHGHSFPDRVQHLFIQLLAREMLQSNARGFEMDGVKVLALEAAEEFGSEAGDAELQQLADHHFVTVDHSEGDEVRFNHQVFREYFQALAVADSIKSEEREWLIAVLTARPMPEGVSDFISEITSSESARNLLACVGRIESSLGYLVPNLASVCAASGSAEVIQELLQNVAPHIPLSFRLKDMDLQQSDWSGRVLDGVQFVRCNLRSVSFDGSKIVDIAFHHSDVTGTSFQDAVPEAIEFDYGPRLFGAAHVLKALSAHGAFANREEEARESTFEEDWRERVSTVLQSRLNKFYVRDPVGGTTGSKWDPTISERNLLGGLDQVERRFVGTELVPELMRRGILSRHREHNQVVYRLVDSARDPARHLIERGEATGEFLETLDRLAPV